MASLIRVKNSFPSCKFLWTCEKAKDTSIQPANHGRCIVSPILACFVLKSGVFSFPSAFCLPFCLRVLCFKQNEPGKYFKMQYVPSPKLLVVNAVPEYGLYFNIHFSYHLKPVSFLYVAGHGCWISQYELTSSPIVFYRELKSELKFITFLSASFSLYHYDPFVFDKCNPGVLADSEYWLLNMCLCLVF